MTFGPDFNRQVQWARRIDWLFTALCKTVTGAAIVGVLLFLFKRG